MVLRGAPQKIRVNFLFNYRLSTGNLNQLRYLYLFLKKQLFSLGMGGCLRKKKTLKRVVFVRGPRGPKSSFVKVTFLKQIFEVSLVLERQQVAGLIA